ncbi:hypothetical protein [Halogeometricum limi]|uniref:Halobacterial output domain-containing protein n=1 Tax=Halogeometricum limi TaxID=555875 RepID=A0A1I6H7J5_9EURY|nr:hypothetical protein [Halogeometricum limi]SFR50536.1 hypothetical protein SAMN04488124_1892 [Halogeometricum limi]
MTPLSHDAPWRTVGRHRFDAPDELDATLATSLRSNGATDTRLRGIDSEEAENLLTSARDADVELEVHVYIDDRLVRIDTDGVVAVRDE